MKKALIVALLLVCSKLTAQNWSTTNIQYLYGSSFNKLIGEKQLSNAPMQTLTFEHAQGWEYGRHFFFVDMTSGDFSNGKNYLNYGEWIPKLSLSKVSQADLSWGFIKDITLAGEINQGDDFRVYNLGFGIDVALVGFDFFELSLYRRKDNFNEATFQLTAAWKSRFELLLHGLVFEGFFDYYGTDFGREIISQPRLLVQTIPNVHVGIELYYYVSSARAWRSAIEEITPQLMVKWTW